MRTVHVSIHASSQTAAVQAFKSLRRADFKLEMGPTLAKLRSGEEVLVVGLIRQDCEPRLTSLLQLVKDLQDNQIEHSLRLVERFASPIGSGPPHSSSPRAVAHSDLEAILKFEHTIQLTAIPQGVLDRLETLRQAQWFSQAGRPIDDPTVIQGTIALAQRDQPRFSEATTAFQNAVTSPLCYHFPYHYRYWNAFVDMVRPSVAELVDEKLHRPLIPVSDPLKTSLSSIILGACIEQYYAQQVPPPAMCRCAEWIVRGHLPYGWEGRAPDGKLIVA